VSLTRTQKSTLIGGLRDAVLAFTSGTISPEALNRFVRLCHSIASGQLANRTNTAVLSRVHGLSSSDIAYDCISDLFQRDGGGRFVQIETYFSGLPFAEFEDAELLIHLRRLISSKVNLGIFRMLNEADPSLGKILRNLKLAIATLQQFEEVERFGEPYIRPSLCDTLEHLPEPTIEDLERALTESSSGSAFVPDLLAKFSIYLRTQEQFKRTVPLVSLALAIRTASIVREQLPSEGSSPVDLSLVFDAPTIVRLTMTDIRNRGRQLVVKRKITCELLDQYCKVIEEGLTRRLVHCDGEDFTFFEALRTLKPELTKLQYRAAHRARLEYLAGMANAIAAKWMKRA
jgi:hypothetical protein